MKVVLRIAAGAVVLGSMILAFYLAGTPGENRAMRRDELRAADLGALSSKVIYFTTSEQRRPASVEELVGWCEGRAAYQCRKLGEDEANEYVYRIVDDRNFELCATFETRSPSHDAERRTRHPRHHDAGMDCYLYLYPQITDPSSSSSGGSGTSSSASGG